MDTRTVEQVNQWESRPYSGGLAGLRELADGFSGAVRAAGTWAFVLNGRVVGVFEGDLADLEDHDGTAYRAPDQALPLLFAMQELGGKTQAKYYTNDTPLSEVHDTLSSANFSGYVELSENVLSGDYYVVYYGGRSMSAAFVGESERLLTGDEAFERADDEVGIYEVRKVDLDVTDLSAVVEEAEPEPEPSADPGPEPDETPEPTEEGPDRTAEEDEAPGPDASETEPAVETPEVAEAEPDRREPDSTEPDRPEPEPDRTDPKPDRQEPTGGDADTREPGSPEPARADPETADAGEAGSSASPASGSEPDSSEGADTATPDSESASAGSNTQQEVHRTDDVFNEEQQWRQARAIPALDPGRSSDRSGAAKAARSRSKSTSKGRSTTKSGSSAAETKSSKGTESADDASVDEYKQALAQSKQEIERLSERLSKTESEQQELLAEREELRSEVERLETELERARASDDGESSSAGRSLPAQEALEGTNLFVRYASKSQPTLEDARDGADREEVNANLSLEHHTQFEADEVAVDGTEFGTFLRESIQYRFVAWLIEDLLYEVRDTGHVGQLRELFDAIPRIDRAELDGNATIRKTEDGEEVRTQRTFDVILRDRMGNPLVVANLNDARDPATGDMMADLVAAANDVGETSESLSAAVFVTASFFEPQALETAAEATGGGLLSREKKESYVKLSRKRGYHLCLVETRGGQFHVNVPEL